MSQDLGRLFGEKLRRIDYFGFQRDVAMYVVAVLYSDRFPTFFGHRIPPERKPTKMIVFVI
jgi:hypothetical protein